MMPFADSNRPAQPSTDTYSREKRSEVMSRVAVEDATYIGSVQQHEVQA
jgi:hypothetical protein